MVAKIGYKNIVASNDYSGVGGGEGYDSIADCMAVMVVSVWWLGASQTGGGARVKIVKIVRNLWKVAMGS